MLHARMYFALYLHYKQAAETDAHTERELLESYDDSSSSASPAAACGPDAVKVEKCLQRNGRLFDAVP
jgi:hypothetical protein